MQPFREQAPGSPGKMPTISACGNRRSHCSHRYRSSRHSSAMFGQQVCQSLPTVARAQTNSSLMPRRWACSPTTFIWRANSLSEVAVEPIAAEQAGHEPELEHVEPERRDHVHAGPPVVIRPPVGQAGIGHVRVVGVEQVLGKIVVINPPRAELVMDRGATHSRGSFSTRVETHDPPGIVGDTPYRSIRRPASLER